MRRAIFSGYECTSGNNLSYYFRPDNELAEKVMAAAALISKTTGKAKATVTYTELKKIAIDLAMQGTDITISVSTVKVLKPHSIHISDGYEFSPTSGVTNYTDL